MSWNKSANSFTGPIIMDISSHSSMCALKHCQTLRGILATKPFPVWKCLETSIIITYKIFVQSLERIEDFNLYWKQKCFFKTTSTLILFFLDKYNRPRFFQANKHFLKHQKAEFGSRRMNAVVRRLSCNDLATMLETF